MAWYSNQLSDGEVPLLFAKLAIENSNGVRWLTDKSMAIQSKTMASHATETIVDMG